MALYFYYIILRMVLCKPTSIYDKIYSFLTFSDRHDFEKQGGKTGGKERIFFSLPLDISVSGSYNIPA